MTTIPSLFETVVATGDYTTLPVPEVPYYVVAKEGFFTHKHTEIGNVLLKQHDTPKELPALGITGGLFTWQGDKVPGEIISQAHDFFRRIYAAHHSEAEVLITKNDEGSYRLFVPYQRASAAGVKSIYEPTHIAHGWLVVGTLHSHCDFSAFHSSTDSGDASDMDGVHFTIGFVTRDEPQIVAMVAMSGKEFHYKEPSEIADLAYGTKTAPTWWDQFVFAGSRSAPEQKPVGLVSLTQEHWNEFLGRPLRKPGTYGPTKHVVSSPGWKPSGYTPNANWGAPTSWSRYPVIDRDWDSDDWKDWGKPKTKVMTHNTANDAVDTILDRASALGLFNDEDWDATSVTDMDELAYWEGFFKTRAANMTEILAMIEGAKKKGHTPPRRKRLRR